MSKLLEYLKTNKGNFIAYAAIVGVALGVTAANGLDVSVVFDLLTDKEAAVEACRQLIMGQ